MANCSACDARITWAITEPGGKRIPLDFDPVPEGNIEVVGRTNDGTMSQALVRVLKKGELDTLPGMPQPLRYVSHFATCPYAKNFRRRDEQQTLL